MVTRIIGYAISLVGVAGMAYPLIPQLNDAVKIPESIPSFYITIGSLVLVGMGIALSMGGSRGGRRTSRREEVPIYEGKRIIGYRRN